MPKGRSGIITEEFKGKENTAYHDVEKLFKIYRSVNWKMQIKINQVKRHFQLEYGTDVDKFLDSLYQAGMDVDTDLASEKERVESINHSNKFLKLMDESVDLMRKYHPQGERYYWVLYYSYMSAYKAENVEEILDTAALITRLKKERYISLRCKDGYRGYVLLEKGRNYLLSEYEKELSFFISGSGQTGHVKSEPEKRMRLYRMSEVWVFFWKAGIEILRNHKPDMDKGFVRDRGKAFYYGSLEFKGMSEAIRGSRSCGVLLSGDTVLVVYNTMDRNMKWAKKMECSMRTWTERMLLKGGYNSKADALIVGQNIKVLLKLLESDGGIKKDLFRPDDIYDQYYYIPMCREGILQIVLLTEKRKREKLKQSLFSRFSIKREKEYATYNVCDENGNPIYLVYDLEMRQLCRIKQELLWRPSVSIVCMDYQAETIREYLGEKVIIYELNAENVMKYLINDLGE